MTALGHRLLRGMAVGPRPRAGLVPPAPHRRPADPVPHLPLPARGRLADPNWGVAEHTDYGLLTILRQDDQRRPPGARAVGWIDAPPIPGTFVCNLGDMLERMTGGRYRSTPHRVRNPGDTDRLSFPFFFDPAWDAEVLPVPGLGEPAGAGPRAAGTARTSRLHRHLRRLPLDQGRPRLPRPPTTSVTSASAWRC